MTSSPRNDVAVLE